MGFLFAPKPEMVTPESALRGGSMPVNPDPAPHAVFGTPLRQDGKEVLIGIGCFWGAEKLMWNTPGVVSTEVGYAGGFTPNPTYREVCSGRTGHAEVVRVLFDDSLSVRDIVALALEAHDPTQGYRQGNDVGTQYRSIFCTHEPEVVRDVVSRYGEKLAEHGFPPITTEVTAMQPFYLAEDEHQQYLYKNPHGYCPVHSTGISCGN
ncbi:peptide-methionine (S)-S-oxide reductase MsrA [Corynebacterium sp. H128]|uniref:peptide-methionine (S)-S-oxide reductase MsrA n=1 Tax=Corynebacterium sp. H128 TaxID=3133427 RepID=UPI00309CD5A3